MFCILFTNKSKKQKKKKTVKWKSFVFSFNGLDRTELNHDVIIKAWASCVNTCIYVLVGVNPKRHSTFSFTWRSCVVIGTVRWDKSEIHVVMWGGSCFRLSLTSACSTFLILVLPVKINMLIEWYELFMWRQLMKKKNSMKCLIFLKKDTYKANELYFICCCFKPVLGHKERGNWKEHLNRDRRSNRKWNWFCSFYSRIQILKRNFRNL